MPQAGLHTLIGSTTRKIAPRKEWAFLGILLGNMVPDLDNYAVAIVTLMGGDTQALHRTFTHSVFTIIAIWLVFFAIAKMRSDNRWNNLGIGLGIGIGMHILLDLVGWFNGVPLLWPLEVGYINVWAKITPPEWFMTLMGPAEFPLFALYLIWLRKTAQAQNTDAGVLKGLRGWIIAMWILFIIMAPLAYIMTTGYQTILGATYLIALTATFILTIKMRQTVTFAG